MSTLIVQIPPRPRLSAREVDPPALRPAQEYNFALSSDGKTVAQHGRAAPAVLPKARTTVVVVDDADLAWQRVDVPKAAGARMRAALIGLLEETLLEDDSDVHLALEPGAKGGAPAWIVAISRSWLAMQVGALEAAGLYVDQVVPATLPGLPTRAHASVAIDPLTSAPSDHHRLTLAGEAGVLCAPLAAAPALTAGHEGIVWSSTPAAASDAEHAAGGAVPVISDAEVLVRSSQSGWNLRQFELAPRQRGTRALRSAVGKFLGPDWAPVRYGLATLVVVQLVGLNVTAWQQRRAVEAQKAAITQLLRDTFPQVRAIQNPPVQMSREVDLLRASAGRPGEGDLEPLLYAAESAWPSSRGPMDSLKFEPGRLSLSASGWTPQEIERFRTQLQAVGVALEANAGRMTLSRQPFGKSGS